MASDMSWYTDDRSPGNRPPPTPDELAEQRVRDMVDGAVQSLLGDRYGAAENWTDRRIADARQAVLAVLTGKPPGPAAPSASLGSAAGRAPGGSQSRPGQAAAQSGSQPRGPVVTYVAGKKFYGRSEEADAAAAEYHQRMSSLGRTATGRRPLWEVSNFHRVAQVGRLVNAVERVRDPRNPDDLAEIRAVHGLANGWLAEVPGGRSGLEAHYRARHRPAPDLGAVVKDTVRQRFNAAKQMRRYGK